MQNPAAQTPQGFLFAFSISYFEKRRLVYAGQAFD
jgi:hypothetical protein